MDDQNGKRVSPFRLPMAVAQNLDSRFYFDQALFRRRHRDTPGKKEAGQGLYVPAAQTAPRDESLGLPSAHQLILNGMWLEDILWEKPNADF